MKSRTIYWKQKETCLLCGNNPRITSITYDKYEKLEEYELYSTTLDSHNFILIDIRGKSESNEPFLKKLKIINIPFETNQNTLPKIEPDNIYLFFCNHGIKSKELVKRFRSAGFKNTFSLKDGIDGVKKILKD